MANPLYRDVSSSAVTTLSAPTVRQRTEPVNFLLDDASMQELMARVNGLIAFSRDVSAGTFTFSGGVDIPLGTTYRINGTVVLSATALGSSVTMNASNITSGTLSADRISTGSLAVNKLAASTISGVTLGNNLNAVTFDNGGAGAASGSTYNGSAAVTVSYNTIGAPSTTGTGASGSSWNISILGNAATVTNGMYLSGNQDISGVKVFATPNGQTYNLASGNLGLTVYNNTAGADAMMTFHISNDWAGYFGLGGAENDLVWTGWSVGNNRYRILHTGNYSNYAQFAVGLTAPGIQANYADPSGWVSGTNTGTGYYGGNFTLNGGSSENSRQYADTPYASPGLIWSAINNDGTSNDDGGWNKTITGLNANKTYRSIVWVRRNSSSTNGTFYHGCDTGGNTLNLDNSANGNPYFGSFGISTLTQGRWYLSVGYIHANSDGSTTSYGGLYDSVTGTKVVSYTDFKMASGATTQNHRVYLFYSTDSAARLDWWGTRFEEVNGNEPSINALLLGASTVLNSSNYSSYAIPVGGGINMTGSFGLNDQRLYLRTNGDTNHYLWNADDDWEELVAYSGTGFRVKSSTGTNLMTFSTSAVNAGVALQQGGNQVLHAGNYSSYALPLGGGTVTGLTTFNAQYLTVGNSGMNTGVFINHGSGTGDYGALRFYQAGVNNQTIHIFSTNWQSGTLASTSTGAINIDGANGVTFGPWNSVSGYITDGGNFWSRGSITAGNTLYTLNGIEPTGVGTNSGATGGAYLFGYQEAGDWVHPYPDLVIGYHTGIKIGAYTGYNGVRFFADHPSRTSTGGTTELFSVGNGDNHVRVNNNLYITSQLFVNRTDTVAGRNSRINLTYNSSILGMMLQNSSTDTTFAINLINSSGSYIGGAATSTTGTDWQTSSDYRLKENLQSLTNSGAFIDAIQPKTWTWKINGSRGVGFVAHELQEVSPASVSGEKDAVLDDGTIDPQAVAYASSEIIANMVAELQALRKRVADLEARIT